MSRRRRAKKRKILPDPYYNSELIHMLVNRIMKNGKKTLAYKIIYQTMELISKDIEQQKKTKEKTLNILNKAIENVKPSVEVKPRRVGGSIYQVPLTVNSERGTVLAIKWILNAANNRVGKSSVLKLKTEIIDAFNNKGNAVKRRDEIARMADANKAFSKFRSK